MAAGLRQAVACSSVVCMGVLWESLSPTTAEAAACDELNWAVFLSRAMSFA